MFRLARQCYYEVDKAAQELKILDKSIEALKEQGDNIINYKLGIYDKLNWNATLISFNSISLNSVFTNIGASSETSQKFPDNGGS